ncbi:MAG: hypothetical protein WCA12_16425 [Burkholderiales bacterium]
MNPSTDPHRVDLDIRGGEIFGIAKLVRAYRSDDAKEFVTATFNGTYMTSW